MGARELDPPETDAATTRERDPPDGGREIPGLRGIRIALRTCHIAAFGTLYGGHVYAVAPDRLAPALGATLATGSALVALEVWNAPRWLLQVRGLTTLLKVALTVTVAISPLPSVGILTVVLALGAISSHMPSGWRYYSIFHGRVIGPRGKG